MQQGKPISFLSKSLGVRAVEMSTYDKEAMSTIEALKKWKHFLAEVELILRTDQQSLKHMGEQRLVQGIHHKLLVKLMGYNYRIEYKKGKENRVVDALSQRPQEEYLNSISTVVPLWITDVLTSYEGDPKCKELEEQLRLHPAAISNFTLTNGILRYKTRIYVGASFELRNQLIDSFHNSALGGHSGERVTYTKLKSLFHWPRMRAAVSAFIKICPVCQLNKTENVPYPDLLQPLPIPDMAWQHVTMDFIKALPKSEGKNIILVVVDKLTKYAHFMPMCHSSTTRTVVQLFIDNVFKLHGLPLAIITNRDGIFTSQMWQDLFK
jgi:hypothetical protein